MSNKLIRILLITIAFLVLLLLGWAIVTSLRAKGTGFKDKTLYDWFDLLIVPVVLAIAAWLLNREERSAQNRYSQQRDKTEHEISEIRVEADRELALDRYRDGLLHTYLDQMTELLLEKGLRSSEPTAEIRSVARVRTLMVLDSLDGARKGVVIYFLKTADLIRQGPDFTKSQAVISLQGANLFSIKLAGVDLNNSDLHGVNLKEADLRWALLDGSNLQNADMRAAILHKAQLRRTRLRGADFSGADLSESYFDFADLPRIDLPNADLTKPGPTFSLLDQTLYSPIQFRGANLSKASFREAYLSGADLSSADLTESMLERAYLQRANFRDAKLCRAWMPGAYLSRASLQHADLTGANLFHAYLGAADLSHADLSKANLSKAILYPSRIEAMQDANIKEDDLTPETNDSIDTLDYLSKQMILDLSMKHADFTGVNLTEADLTKARITKEQLAQAKSLKNVISDYQ